MTKFLDGTSLFASAKSGLASTYSILAQLDGGASYKNLADKSSTEALTANNLGTSFKQYMQSNFSSFDQNADGVISSSELEQYSNDLEAQGMTREQLYQLGTQGGISSSLLETVLAHFDDIDTNKDGKVTNSEIKAYGVTSSIENQKTKDIDRLVSNMSTFYETESSDVGSMLDYKYLSDKSNDDNETYDLY